MRTAILDGLWHFDPNPKGLALIRHAGSGLTFRRAPEAGDPLALKAVSIDDPLQGWPDRERIALIGRAAVFPAVDGEVLRDMGGHAGAIYFRYTGTYSQSVIEDAPTLA